MEKKRISLGSLMVMCEVLQKELLRCELEIEREKERTKELCVLMARRAELERAIFETRLIEVNI